MNDILVTQLVLKLYDPNAECSLFTDASVYRRAGILVQTEGAKERPVAYFSRQTSTDEQKFHSFKLETLAIVTSIERFRPYLLGKKFTLFTDCAAVRRTFVKKDLNAKISRWVLQLSEYDYAIHHRPGIQMNDVDALSSRIKNP